MDNTARKCLYTDGVGILTQTKILKELEGSLNIDLEFKIIKLHIQQTTEKNIKNINLKLSYAVKTFYSVFLIITL